MKSHVSTLVISLHLKGKACDAIVRELLQLSWGKARSLIETGKVSIDGVIIRDPRAVPMVGENSILALNMNAPKNAVPKGASSETRLLKDQVIYQDSQIVVVNKPPGLSTVPFNKNEVCTLQHLVCNYFKLRSIEVVHRIDKDTSGLVVFARTKEAAKHLAQQFRFHSINRKYFALVYGVVKSQTIKTRLLENRGDGLSGSWQPHMPAYLEGKEAITHVELLKSSANKKISLIACTLETGRTHQIRIHLSELGHPLLGEKLYSKNTNVALLDLESVASRQMLHAAELGIMHPTRNQRLIWSAPLPNDFQLALKSAGIEL